MVKEIILPKLGMDMSSGTIIKWFLEEGESITKGEPLLEILTDKVSIEVEAESSGVLLKKIGEVDEEYPVLTVIGYLGEPGEEIPEAQKMNSEESVFEKTKDVEKIKETENREAIKEIKNTEDPNTIKELKQEREEIFGKVRATPAARRLAKQEHIVIENLVGTGPQGRIQIEDVQKIIKEEPRPLVEIEEMIEESIVIETSLEEIKGNPENILKGAEKNEKKDLTQRVPALARIKSIVDELDLVPRLDTRSPDGRVVRGEASSKKRFQEKEDAFNTDYGEYVKVIPNEIEEALEEVLKETVPKEKKRKRKSEAYEREWVLGKGIVEKEMPPKKEGKSKKETKPKKESNTKRQINPELDFVPFVDEETPTQLQVINAVEEMDTDVIKAIEAIKIQKEKAAAAIQDLKEELKLAESKEIKEESQEEEASKEVVEEIKELQNFSEAAEEMQESQALTEKAEEMQELHILTEKTEEVQELHVLEKTAEKLEEVKAQENKIEAAQEPTIVEKPRLGDRLLGKRKLIAERMIKSNLETAVITLSTEIDMTEVKDLRKKITKKIEEQVKYRCTFTDFLLMAVSRALIKHPLINSSLMGDEIIKYPHVHMGLAVGLDDGLLVPVIRNTHEMDFVTMVKNRAEILKAVKNNYIVPNDLKGSTFTVTNLGMYGILEFTAIINQPNSAILSVGEVVHRMRLHQGEPAMRSVMKISLNLDHRVADGMEGAKFLKEVKNDMENPSLLLF